jgi:hypothetical protein
MQLIKQASRQKLDIMYMINDEINVNKTTYELFHSGKRPSWS